METNSSVVSLLNHSRLASLLTSLQKATRVAVRRAEVKGTGIPVSLIRSLLVPNMTNLPKAPLTSLLTARKAEEAINGARTTPRMSDGAAATRMIIAGAAAIRTTIAGAKVTT